MEISKQCCSLEQAKRLYKLGIKSKDYQYAYVDFGTEDGQESVLCRPASNVEEQYKEWAWFIVGSYSKLIQDQIDECSLNADGGIYRAFTVAELGVMLPIYNYAMKRLYKENGKIKEDWIAETNQSISCCGETQARVLAELLIYYLEENIITAEEVNQRLNQN